MARATLFYAVVAILGVTLVASSALGIPGPMLWSAFWILMVTAFSIFLLGNLALKIEATHDMPIVEA